MTKNFNSLIQRIMLVWLVLLISTSLYAAEQIKNLPDRNPYFTGRVDHLDKVRKILKNKGIIYLVGYGGVGKSQLAKEFSHLHEHDYDLIWWIDSRGDLKIQYENLLTHLSNDEKFKKLMHINVKDLAPSALIGFTNSLLAKCNCSWLLIFDNVVNTQELNLPKTYNAKNIKKHLIITTREQQIFANKVLMVPPFTDREAEGFLSKLHPNEQRGDIIRLREVLYNYPLALAQVSEVISIYKNSIGEYLTKYDSSLIKNAPIHSDIIQGYHDSYNLVLNNTLQEIEQKNQRAAKVLYMLALLKADIAKDMLYDIFGKEIEDELIVLNKYGIAQTVSYVDTQMLNIHDIIREATVKRFENKNRAYKMKVMSSLIRSFSDFYSEKNLQDLLNNPGKTNNRAEPLYAFIERALQYNVINEQVIDTIIISLKINNSVFSKFANYPMYQHLANEVYAKKMNKVSSTKKALLYANLVYADFMFQSGQSLTEFEQEFIRLLSIVELGKNYEALFFIYTQISQLYLLLGDLKEAKRYLKKAEENIGYTNDMFSLTRYWYTKARICRELREIDEGLEAFDNYEKIRDNFLSDKMGKLTNRAIRIKLKIFSGRKNEAKKELAEAMKITKIYYNNIPSSVVVALESLAALIYFQDGRYDLAYAQCQRVIEMGKKVYGKEMVADFQLHIHALLGKIYENKGSPELALKEYKKCLQYYDEHSYGRAINSYEYGELLANLCVLHYQQKEYNKSKIYFQKLASSFGLGNKIIEKLIKELPVEYIYQIGAHDHG